MINKPYLRGILKTVGAGCLSLMLATSALAPQVIKNSKTPLAKNAGRVLELKEVLRISEKSEQFYFGGNPGGFTGEAVNTDGDIYIQSGKSQILRFTPGGEFIKNLIRGGQGPGEVSEYFKFLVDGRDIFIVDFGQNRVIRLTTDGELVHQWTVPRAYDDLIGILGEGLLFSRTNYPPIEDRKGKLMDTPHEILRVSKDGSEEKLVHTFSVLRFLAQGAAAFWAPFHAALSDDSRFLFVNHTAEYEISVLDLSTGKIIKTFTREYPRVKHVPFPGEDNFSRKYNFKRPYEADITGLYIFKNRLWVKTSMTDKERGTLYDVFSLDGAYLDAFVLKVNMTSIQRGRLMIWEADAEGNASLVIYTVRD
jgi:hypothetical protein